MIRCLARSNHIDRRRASSVGGGTADPLRCASNDDELGYERVPVVTCKYPRRKEAEHRSFACSGYAVLKIQKERRRQGMLLSFDSRAISTTLG
jgi:hypothetical protein